MKESVEPAENKKARLGTGLNYSMLLRSIFLDGDLPFYALA